ncbi:hypothetical protein D1003_07525 [Riemerella anatipestifer]|nr:hypothetical protein [Riemerella anatipestifer]
MALQAQDDYSGRVGINTSSPNATLEISKEGNNESKGLIIPRLTATEVKTMTDNGNVGENQNSMMVYITEGFATPDTDKVGKYELIDATGYYYYDHNTATPENSRWRKIGTGVYTAGKGMKLNNTEFSRTGLEEVTENGKTGWRLIGQNSDARLKTGKRAVDLSYSPEISNTEEFNVYDYSNSFDTPTVRQTLTFDRLWSDTTVPHPFRYKRGAFGDLSVALGTYAMAGNLGSSSLGGVNTYSVGLFSTAVGGYNNFAIGSNSIVLGGSGNVAEATGSLVGGGENSGVSKFVTIFGLRATRESRDNNELSEIATGITDHKRRLFVVGNGFNSNSDAFTILRNAKVGIDINYFENTTSDAKLQVNGAIKIGSNSTTTTYGTYDTSGTMPCNESNYGSIKFENDNFYGCKSTGWVLLNN